MTGHRILHAVLDIHQPVFQGRRGAKNLLGARRVLHARQLHHDAVRALLLDDGLGHPQFIDAVAQRGDVLFDGELAHLALFLLAHRDAQIIVAVGVLVGDDHIGVVGVNFGAGLFAFRGILEIPAHHVAVTRQCQVAHFVLAQQGADIADITLRRLARRRFHIDLQQKVHAATQIETEVHGLGIERLQPRRRGRGQIQCHHIIVADRALDRVHSLELGLGVREARQQFALVERNGLEGDIGFFQRLFNLVAQCGIDLEAVCAIDLYRRVLAVEVRQRVQYAQQQHHADQQVLP